MRIERLTEAVDRFPEAERQQADPRVDQQHGICGTDGVIHMHISWEHQGTRDARHLFLKRVLLDDDAPLLRQKLGQHADLLTEMIDAVDIS